MIVEDDAARRGDRGARRAPRRALRRARRAARHQRRPQRRGRRASSGELVCFLDDDVEVWPGWLDALLAAHAGDDAFGGPIRPRLEGSRLRACGREPLPVTALDLGAEDRDAEFVWGANMAIRRAAFERIGPFDETLGGAGDEEDWQRRLRAAGGRVGYVAAAGVDHRRTGRDAHAALARRAPPTSAAAPRAATTSSAATRRRSAAELRTLAGCVWHIVRRRCGVGRDDDRALATAGSRRRSTRARAAQRGRPRLPLRPLGHARAPRRCSSARAKDARAARDGLRARLALRRAARRLPRAARARRRRRAPRAPAHRRAPAPRARALPPRRRAAPRRARARRRQVGEHQRRARRRAAARRRLAADRRRRRRSCRAASSTASWPPPRRSGSSSPSPRTRSPRTPPGTSPAAAPGCSRAARASSRSAR